MKAGEQYPWLGLGGRQVPLGFLRWRPHRPMLRWAARPRQVCLVPARHQDGGAALYSPSWRWFGALFGFWWGKSQQVSLPGTPEIFRYLPSASMVVPAGRERRRPEGVDPVPPGPATIFFRQIHPVSLAQMFFTRPAGIIRERLGLSPGPQRSVPGPAASSSFATETGTDRVPARSPATAIPGPTGHLERLAGTRKLEPASYQSLALASRFRPKTAPRGEPWLREVRDQGERPFTAQLRPNGTVATTPQSDQVSLTPNWSDQTPPPPAASFPVLPVTPAWRLALRRELNAMYREVTRIIDRKLKALPQPAPPPAPAAPLAPREVFRLAKEEQKQQNFRQGRY